MDTSYPFRSEEADARRQLYHTPQVVKNNRVEIANVDRMHHKVPQNRPIVIEKGQIQFWGYPHSSHKEES